MEKYTLWCAFSIVFITTFLFHPTESVACYSCEGDEPCEPCSGDYCFIETLTEHSGIRVVKGCSVGNFWQKKRPDSCIRYQRDGATTVTSCICSKDNYCNGVPSDQNPFQMLTCACDQCDAKQCRGEYCAIWYNEKDGKTTKGCINRFMGQIRPTGLVSCEKPAMTGVQYLDRKPEDLANTEQCLCSTDMCNEKKPEDLLPATSSCRTQLTGNGPKGGFNKGGAVCPGQYCYNVTVTDNKSSKKYTQTTATGCLTLGKDTSWSEHFNSVGCQDLKAKEVQVRMCIEMPGGAVRPPPPLPVKTTPKPTPPTPKPTSEPTPEPKPEPEPTTTEKMTPKPEESEESPEAEKSPEEKSPEEVTEPEEDKSDTSSGLKITGTVLLITITSIIAVAFR